MSCSEKTCKICKACRYSRKHFKNFVIKTLVVINTISLFYWIGLIDFIISWQPYAIMLFNATFLFLVSLANGWVYGTKRYYKRIAREKRIKEKLRQEC